MPAMVILFLASAILPYCYHAQIFTVNLPKIGVDYTVDFDAMINQLIRMCFIARLPEFLIGVLSYRFYREVMQSNFKPIYTIYGILASMPFLIWIFVEPPDNMLSTVLYTGQVIGTPFCVFVILGLIRSKSMIVRILSTSGWVLMGEASFGLYLFHIPIKNFGQFVITHVLHQDKGNALLCLFMIVVSVGVSVVLFKKFETPSRKRLTAWWKSRKPTVGPS
jgi:peptidoglycan/LPS O-acetylase OafA/YrhL